MQELRTTLFGLISVSCIAVALNMWSQIAALLWVGVIFGLIALNELIDK